MRIERNKSEPTEVAKPVQPPEPAMASNTTVEPDPVPETVVVDTEVSGDEEDV